MVKWFAPVSRYIRQSEMLAQNCALMPASRWGGLKSLLSTHHYFTVSEDQHPAHESSLDTAQNNLSGVSGGPKKRCFLDTAQSNL